MTNETFHLALINPIGVPGTLACHDQLDAAYDSSGNDPRRLYAGPARRLMVGAVRHRQQNERRLVGFLIRRAFSITRTPNFETTAAAGMFFRLLPARRLKARRTSDDEGKSPTNFGLVYKGWPLLRYRRVGDCELRDG